MVVVVKELLQKLRIARKLKIEAQRPHNELEQYVNSAKTMPYFTEVKAYPKKRGKTRRVLTNVSPRTRFSPVTKPVPPYMGHKIVNRNFYKNAPKSAPTVTIPLWRLSFRLTRNNAFVTLTDTQKGNRILYWTSARANQQNYRLGRSPRRILEMIVPVLVRAMVQGAQIKYLQFRGNFKYVSRVLHSIRRRKIPVWHVLLTHVGAHNGCRRRKQVRK